MAQSGHTEGSKQVRNERERERETELVLFLNFCFVKKGFGAFSKISFDTWVGSYDNLFMQKCLYGNHSHKGQTVFYNVPVKCLFLSHFLRRQQQCCIILGWVVLVLPIISML